MADKLQAAFAEHGIKVRRDIDDVGYKNRIKSYMREIGRGHVVVAIIDDKYLKSFNCMFELIQISKNGDFENRIFPIVLEDARFYSPEDQLDLYGFWKTRIDNLTEKAQQLGLDVGEVAKLGTDFMLLAEIRHELPNLIQILKDMNTLSKKIHIEEDFNSMITQVMERLGV